ASSTLSIQPFDPSNRRTLLAALAGLGGRPSGGCTPYVDVPVPLKGTPLSICRRTYQLARDGRAGVASDRRVVRLVCGPAARARRAGARSSGVRLRRRVADVAERAQSLD